MYIFVESGSMLLWGKLNLTERTIFRLHSPFFKYAEKIFGKMCVCPHVVLTNQYHSIMCCVTFDRQLQRIDRQNVFIQFENNSSFIFSTFVRSVVQWCVPNNATEFIKQYKEQLEAILDSASVEQLPSAVRNIEFIAEIEGVSLLQISFNNPAGRLLSLFTNWTPDD